MFNDKLNNNITAILKDVDLDSDIKKFKSGIDTELNLDKLNISGG